jgi:hypothetical protein
MAKRDTDALLVGVELVGFGLLTLARAGCKLQPVAGVRGALGKRFIAARAPGLPLGSPDWLALPYHVIWSVLHFRCMPLLLDLSHLFSKPEFISGVWLLMSTSIYLVTMAYLEQVSLMYLYPENF